MPRRRLLHAGELESEERLSYTTVEIWSASRSTTGDQRQILRQLEVLKPLADGRSVREIGEELYLSEATVRNHVRSLLQALGAHSQLEVPAKAREVGILTGWLLHARLCGRLSRATLPMTRAAAPSKLV